MKIIFCFVLLFLFIETVVLQYYDDGYGNNPSEDYEKDGGDLQYPNDYYPINDYAPNDEENAEYPNYPETQSEMYPDYPFEEYPDYPISGHDTDDVDNYYPEDISYPEYQPNMYPQNTNYRNPGKHFNKPSHNQISPRGQQKPLSPREKDSNKSSGKNEILEVLKQILRDQKNEHGNEKGSRKADSSGEKVGMKDLLPFFKDIANGKDPNFGEIASKFGQHGLTQIEKVLDDDEEQNVGGNFAKAGFGLNKNML